MSDLKLYGQIKGDEEAWNDSSLVTQLTKADARASSFFAILARDERLCRRRRRFSVISDSILIMY